MIIQLEDLPSYARAYSANYELDMNRVRAHAKHIHQCRLKLSKDDIKKISKHIKTHQPSEQEEKLDSFRKKIYGIHTDAKELGYVFNFCQSELRKCLYDIENQKVKIKLDTYLECFDDLDRLKDIIEILESDPWNTSKYERMLSNLISPYRNVMLELIEFTQNISKPFGSESESDRFSDEMENVMKMLENEPDPQ